jgi:hypothetical protein
VTLHVILQHPFVAKLLVANVTLVHRLANRMLVQHMQVQHELGRVGGVALGALVAPMLVHHAFVALHALVDLETLKTNVALVLPRTDGDKMHRLQVLGHPGLRAKTPTTLVARVFFHVRRIVGGRRVQIHLHLDRVAGGVVAENETPVTIYEKVIGFFCFVVLSLYNF